jgi:hypothetical protein
MDIEVVRTCPLGHTCRKTVGDKIEECMWYVKLVGNDPQTGEPVDQHNCAMAWQPILAVEANGQTRGVAVAVQSLRNESTKRQDLALQMVSNAKAIENK